MTSKELLCFLQSIFTEEISKIESGFSIHLREDTVRTGMTRLLKKIPYFLLTKLNSKADYKSKDCKIVQAAHSKSLSHFIHMLNWLEISNTYSVKHLEHFTCLYFAPSKCRATCTNLLVAEEIISLRGSNSLTKLKQFSSITPQFQSIIELGFKLIDAQKYPVTYDQLRNLNENLFCKL